MRLTNPVHERSLVVAGLLQEVADLLGDALDRAGVHYDSQDSAWRARSGERYALWLCHLEEVQSATQGAASLLAQLRQTPGSVL